jgi:peroxiredoxin Q/BCP
MKTLALSFALIIVASLTLVAVSTCQPAPPVSLKPGDTAPNLKLQGSDGKTYDLAQFRGVKAVAICWFPRAGSQGAKNQCAALEAAMPQIPRDKLQVFGCSTAALDVTTAFAQQGNYSFPVLSDADTTAAKAWGCLRPSGLSERYTYLIDDKGRILAVNRSTTPQTQGQDLLKMLADAGLVKADAAADVPAPPPPLKPGSLFTVKFSDMPPTLFDLLNKQSLEAAMTVFLPRNYDPQRKHPLLIFLNGGDGGKGDNPGVGRALSEEQDFVCVSMPLFKKDIDPADPANTAPLIVIRDQDGRFAWPLYRTMLAKLDEIVPNIDPAHRIIGGFSNGAHMTGELIDQSDGEIARRFSAFLLVEGGGRTQRYDLIKGKPFLMVSSSAKSRPRAQEICDAAKAAGAEATLVSVDVGKHDFPLSAYPAVRQWLRGPGMQ